MKVTRALSGIAAAVIFMALFSPIWSFEAPARYGGDVRISYLDILSHTDDFTQIGDSAADTGALLILISAFCTVLALVLSLVSVVSTKGTGAAAVMSWAAVVTAYTGAQQIMNSTWLMRMVSSVVRINMGMALWLMVITGILLVVAWASKRD